MSDDDNPNPSGARLGPDTWVVFAYVVSVQRRGAKVPRVLTHTVVEMRDRESVWVRTTPEEHAEFLRKLEMWSTKR